MLRRSWLVSRLALWFVYLTDTKREKQVKQVALAEENLHSPIVYPMAVIAASKNPKAVRAYASFLGSRPAKAVFQQYGFGVSWSFSESQMVC
jgi:molybdate transport system substrate-binding protein